MSSSYINWGNETPDQLADRRRLEQEEITLWEQAVNSRAGQTPIAAPGAAAGGSGAGFATTADTSLFISSELGKDNWYIHSLNYNRSSFGSPIDTGINYTDYYLDSHYVSNRKSYFFVFRGNSDYNDYALLFVGAEGNVLFLEYGTTSDLSTGQSQGKWLYAYDYDARVIWYSDGVTVYKNETLLADTYSFDVGADDVDSNSFGLGISTVKLVGDPIEHVHEYYLIPSPTETPVLISSETVNSNIAFNYVMDAYSNKLIKEKYDNSTGEYLSLSVIDSTGTILQFVDLTISPGSYNSFNRSHYGNNKYIWVFFNNSDSSVDYTILQYDGIANVLNTTTHERGSNYPSFDIRTTNAKYPGHFIDSTYSENAIAFFYNSASYNRGRYEVNGCDFITFMNNDAPTVWGFDAIDSIEDRGVYFNNIQVTPTSFFIPCDNGDGIISVLALEGAHSEEFTTFGSPGFSVDDWYVNTWRNGDRTIIRLEGVSNPETNFVVFASDCFTQLGSILNFASDNSNYYYSFDTIYVRCSDSEVINGWVFKNNSSDWEEVGYYDNTIYSWSYYQPTSTYDPGNMFLYKESERIYWFNDTPDGANNIDDGGDDMYDTGNQIETNLGSIAYTHTQMNIGTGNEAQLSDFIMDGEVVAGTGSNFGVGSSYFTNLYPGLFVLSVDNPSINDFTVDGALGSDGSNTGGDYDQATITHNSRTYTYFWKREWNESNFQGEPSVNHLIIIDSDGTDVIHEASGYNDDTDYDSIFYDNPTDLPINKLHFLVFSKWNRIKVSNAELGGIVSSYLNLVDPVGTTLTFSQTLAALNANYQNVTANLPSHATTGQGLMLTPTIFNEFIISATDTIRVGKNRILLVYSDTERDNKVTAKLYNFAGTLLRTLRTDEYDWDDVYAIGNKLILITNEKAYDGQLDLWYNKYNVYKISDSGVSSKSIKVNIAVNSFSVRTNDFTWWYD